MTESENPDSGANHCALRRRPTFRWAMRWSQSPWIVILYNSMSKTGACPRNSRARDYSIFAPLLKLCLAQRILTFSGESPVPPFENGNSWSKCSWSFAPQITHFPPSRL